MIYWEIEDCLIEWEDKSGKIIFDSEIAFAHLLISDVVCISGSDEDSLIVASVNCNDVFAGYAADCELLPYSEIENLYDMWDTDVEFGAAVWCMKRRGRMPQKSIEDMIRKQGIWDLDSMGLAANK